MILAGLSASAAIPTTASLGQAADADAIHRRVLGLDSHADILLPSTPRRYYAPDGTSRVSLDRLTSGGVDAIVLSVAVGPGPRDEAGTAQARAEADAKLAFIRDLVARNPTRAAIALSPDDVERLHREGKVAIIIGFQNARSIGSDVSQLDTFYQAGARVFGLNHAGHNAFSDSSRPWNEPVAEHGGLSPLGRQAVARLNDLGAVIDVSQLSTDALLQTLQLSRAPVAATHSDVRALVDNVRNLTDAELDAIRANGGVVQVTPFSAYLVRETEAQRRRLGEVRARYGLAPEAPSPTDGLNTLSPERQSAFIDDLVALQQRATLSDYVDHIDYIARRLGWQHVGIGTDFDHGAGVTGFDSEAEAPNVTGELVRRGYTEEQIVGIWGGNFLRVWRAAEAARAH
jgi:membrane dipeptidase